MNLDAGTLRRLWPRAPQALVDAVALRAAEVFEKYQLTTALRAAHFMAQISHEFGRQHGDGGEFELFERGADCRRVANAVHPGVGRRLCA